MQTTLAPKIRQSRHAEAIESILRKCVHCGFCNATCPTYQLGGDELDGPRGRIYQMKQYFEGEEANAEMLKHLDRCLTCRSCETTCPSGVHYSHLLEIGKEMIEVDLPRSRFDRLRRGAIVRFINSGWVFASTIRIGQALAGMMPAGIRRSIPQRQVAVPRSQAQHSRKVLMLAGCVQPSMMPNVNTATARVLDAVGVQTVVAPSAGCCGAVKFHLNDHDGGQAHMRANIDAWWPFIAPTNGDTPVESIVMNASGCGVMVKDYGYVLRNEPAYADKAARVSALTKDLSELLPDWVAALRPKLVGDGAASAEKPVLAYHPPCTLQHGQQLRGGVEQHLSQLGFTVAVAQNESHLCCGSAGTYSVLNPDLSKQLRDRKLGNLKQVGASSIISANVGCISHLQSGTDVPVRHWVEVLDAALTKASVAG